MKTVLKILVAVAILFIVLALRPIYDVHLEDTINVRGALAEFQNVGTTLDVSISIQGDEHYYYINRGVQHGLKPDQLNESYAGSNVTLWYADHWTPLDPFSRYHHVSKLSIDNQIIFDEIQSE